MPAIMKLPDPLIIQKLESLNEHKMAKEIFVPVLKNMGLKGVRYVGGSDEHGIDIEYYETSEPDKKRKYTGIQFKKGTLKYGAGGNKNTVKEVKNQAEEAFEKEIYGIDNDSKSRIHRFICAVTGSINETARKVISKAKIERGGQIDYWEGEYLCELIRGSRFYCRAQHAHPVIVSTHSMASAREASHDATRVHHTSQCRSRSAAAGCACAAAA
jgi:hypothetical protein